MDEAKRGSATCLRSRLRLCYTYRNFLQELEQILLRKTVLIPTTYVG
jgi:hypothetical protein